MERRHKIRHPANFSILLSSQDIPPISLRVSNYSEDGLYVLSNRNLIPKIGSTVKVQLSERPIGKTEPPRRTMVVKRTDRSGFGLQYLSV